MNVREFAIVFPIALPKPGRVEEEISKISRTFTSHFQSMIRAHQNDHLESKSCNLIKITFMYLCYATVIMKNTQLGKGHHRPFYFSFVW